jgi:hypothetical protein
MFDEADRVDGKLLGGQLKDSALTKVQRFENIQCAERPALPELIRDLVRVLSSATRPNAPSGSKTIQNPTKQSWTS